MAETLRECNGEKVWFASNIITDLVQQAGLKEKNFELTGLFEFNYKQNEILLTHRVNQAMFVSTRKELGDLIYALAFVVNYEPFAKYNLNLNGVWVTYEWNKINPMMKYFDLMADKEISDLVQL